MIETIHLKIIIVGDSGTGKTSIIKRYTTKEFSDTLATIAPTYYSKIFESNGNKFQINIWDLPGQDRTPIIQSHFARDIEGIIYCCDVTNTQSRDNLKVWENELKSKEDIENVKKIIVENKCDLLGDESNYNYDINSLGLFSKELQCLNFYRTSAKLGYNIDEAIEYLIDQIVKDLKEKEIKEQYKPNNKKKLSNKKTDKNMQCC